MGKKIHLKANARFIVLAATLMVLGPVTAMAGPVTVGANDWMQPFDTASTGWNDIAAVCDATTGVCTGSLGGVVLDGWKWASVAEVGALFMEFNPLYPGGNAYAQELSSTWGPAFLALFQPTEVQSTASIVNGWTRTQFTGGIAGPGAYIMYVRDNTLTTPQFDTMGGQESFGFDSPFNPNTGGWFYRATPIVPEPATLTLLLGGLGVLGIGVWRRM